MSLISSQPVAVQNGCVQGMDSLLQNVQFCPSSTMPSDKAADAVTGSKAQKILQYGSRHTIQNTGWTTRLSCEQSARRNPFLAVQKLALPPMSGFRPLYPSLPFISVTTPTILNLPLSAPVTATAAVKPGTVVSEVGASGSQNVVEVQSTALSVTQCTMVSSTDPIFQSVIAQTNTSASALSSSFALNPTVLAMPTIDSHPAGKPAAVCFIPVSSVICAPVPGLSTDMRMIENVTSPFAVTQAPRTLVNIQNLNLGPLFTQPHAVDESITAVTNAATKPLSSSVMPAKEVVTWSSDGQVSGVKMLTMKVHIDHGHITEVTEVSEKQAQSQAVPGLFGMHPGTVTSAVVSSVKAGQLCMDHVDSNGAQFGYHDLIDGSRIRIARETSGQRHAPIFLLPECDDFCPFEECSVELKTSSNTEPQVIPEEADVSEVGTVFTYEPLFVSEQTLVPLPKKKITPYDSVASLSEDESNYYYRCYMCPFISRDHAKVCKHWVNVHLTELPYCCPYCDRTFFTSTKAQVHVQRQHKGGATIVAFQRSKYFANTLSYQLAETDNDEGSDSDEGEEQQIVLEQLDHQLVQRKDSTFECHKCRFKTRSSVEMRQHVKFVHGHGHFTLVKPGDSRLVSSQKAKNINMQSQATDHLLQAEIAWSNISEKMILGGEQWFKCRWCALQVKDPSLISLHVLQEHNWPAAVLCPSCSCNLHLTDDDRRSTSVVCCSCKAKILLAASADDSFSKETQDLIFMCNFCAFKTRGKATMCRHIKYNHTKCRPFTCVYCNYVAIERAQVKVHITSYHPEQSVIIKERTEASDQFRHIFDNLFSKLVSVQKSDGTKLQLNEDGDGIESESGGVVTSSDVSSPLFTCKECKLETLSLEQLIQHQHRFHKSMLSANAAAMVPPVLEGQTGGTAVPAGEHFKCKICGYCSLDRSCMSRHVKYMHIIARPHSCMYCSYNNVEKTKVRLHLMTHHPGRPKTVCTDYKTLEEMSWQAKNLYVRINRTGEVIDGGNGVSNVDRSRNSPSDRLHATSMSSSDSELAEDDDENATSVKKEEGTDADDDVDIGFYPRRNVVDDEALLSSILMLDHNYVRILAPNNQASVCSAHDASVMIKEEPLDVDFKDEVSDMLGSSFLLSENDGYPEVKSEVTDEYNSAMANSPNSYEMSENDDDFYDSDRSADSSFGSEHLSDGESWSNTDEPVRKKIRVSFGAVEESAMVESVVINSDVWEDPKMHMTPVVELDDVLQIILAWQQDVGETDDIM